jgi:hypothetical protein
MLIPGLGLAGRALLGAGDVSELLGDGQRAPLAARLNLRGEDPAHVRSSKEERVLCLSAVVHDGGGGVGPPIRAGQGRHLTEFFRPHFHRGRVDDVALLGKSLQAWIVDYDNARPNNGDYMRGRTPLQV